MKIDDLKHDMIGKTFAHKADDFTPVSVGPIVRFENIHNTTIPVINVNGEEKLCLGIVFEYDDKMNYLLNHIPLSNQYNFLKSLKLSFNAFRDLNPRKYNWNGKEFNNNPNKKRKSNVSVIKPTKNLRPKRYVIWNDNGIGGELIYLNGYSKDSLATYAALFIDAKKYVPSIDANETICTKVKKSNCVKGFTLMMFTINIRKRNIKGVKEIQWGYLGIDAF